MMSGHGGDSLSFAAVAAYLGCGGRRSGAVCLYYLTQG